MFHDPGWPRIESHCYKLGLLLSIDMAKILHFIFMSSAARGLGKLVTWLFLGWKQFF